jgi:hypothetical protein
MLNPLGGHRRPHALPPFPVIMPPDDAEATMARKLVYGIHQGIVDAANDPDQLGRLKVRVPSVLGDTATRWARPCVADANRSAATFNPPPVGTPIWIQFEGGDTSMPVWLGFPLTQ